MSVFGDKRLDKRLEKLKASIKKRPCGSLPEMLKEWSEVKAAYRFLK